MFKIIFPAIAALVLCLPTVGSAQDCCGQTAAPVYAPAPVADCCAPEPVCAPACPPRTRKRLKLVSTTKEVCRLKRECGTDACGCPTSKLVRVKECVETKRLALVDVPVDPCKKRCFSKLRDSLKNLGKSCCKPDPCAAPDPCGCGCN